MGKNNSPRIKFDDLKRIQLRQNQKIYSQKICENDITFSFGPAGSSKTFSAAYTALKLLADKSNKYNKIVCTKPIQESGEKLGHLPGDVKEKIQPFIETFTSNFDKIIGSTNREILEEVGQIKYKPLAYMRGATFDNAIMILDEAQNCNFKQLMLFITRMGKNSKVIVSGDISQYDIKFKEVGLPDFINMVDGIKGIAHHEFTEKDIVRNKILIEVVNRYNKWKYKDSN